MSSIKRIKKRAKESLRKSYWRSFAVCFIVTILIGGTSIISNNNTEDIPNLTHLSSIDGKNNSEIVNDFVNGVLNDNEVTIHPSQKEGFLSSVLNNVSNSGSFIFGILNAMNQFLFQDQVVAGIIIVVGVLFSLLYWIFISQVLVVGKCRFFLENQKFTETHIGRILLPYKIKKMVSVSSTMLLKNIYYGLWSITIVGFFVKYYSYLMVPYILAENPNIKGNDAITLSRHMMNGEKWNAFKLDCSFFGWFLLGFITLNLSNLFYFNPYHELSYANFYMDVRKKYKKQKLVFREYLKDDVLEGTITQKQYPESAYFIPEHSSRSWLRHLNYKKSYSFSSYVLFFFAFSFLGFLWEVCLTLFSEGIFVNRGTLYGPWLPIYGSGGVLVLFLLQKIRDKPVVTFFFTMLICGIVEYGTAWYLETYHHLKWWDYTGYFLNIDGRICLEGLIFFGIGGLGFIYVLAPLLDNIFQKMNLRFKNILCVCLILFITFDFYCSGKKPNSGDFVTTKIACKSTTYLIDKPFNSL